MSGYGEHTLGPTDVEELWDEVRRLRTRVEQLERAAKPTPVTVADETDEARLKAHYGKGSEELADEAEKGYDVAPMGALNQKLMRIHPEDGFTDPITDRSVDREPNLDAPLVLKNLDPQPLTPDQVAVAAEDMQIMAEEEAEPRYHRSVDRLARNDSDPISAVTDFGEVGKSTEPIHRYGEQERVPTVCPHCSSVLVTKNWPKDSERFYQWCEKCRCTVTFVPDDEKEDQGHDCNTPYGPQCWCERDQP